MGNLSKLSTGLLKGMKFKKNRKNGSSKKIKDGQFEEKRHDGQFEEKRRDGQFEEKHRCGQPEEKSCDDEFKEKCLDARIEEKSLDGQSEKNRRDDHVEEKHRDQSEEKRHDQFKKTEHFAESNEPSESSNDKSKLIHKLDRSLHTAIISNLNGFSDLLFGQLDVDDVERLMREFADVFKRLLRLPVISDEDLRSGEVFIELASAVKEEIMSALVANYDLTKLCFRTSKEARQKRIARNARLVSRLKEMKFRVSKREDGRLGIGKRLTKNLTKNFLVC